MIPWWRGPLRDGRARRAPARAVRALALLGLFAFVGACNPQTRHRVLSFVFEGVPEPGEPPVEEAVVRYPRRKFPTVPPTPTPPPPAEESAPAEKVRVELRKWEDLQQHFPKDSAGGLDWTKAVTTGLVSPQVGIAPDAAAPEILGVDVERVPKSGPEFKVVFGHAVHTEWLACDSCHSGLFEMAGGGTAFGMADLYAGKACGACHGPVAFGMAACDRCHLGNLPKDTAGDVDWGAALRDGVIQPQAGIKAGAVPESVLDVELELTPASNPAFKARFPHAAHTEWLACGNCHDGIFQMASGADEIKMADLYEGKSCGICHGSVAFGVGNCARCHPASAEAKPAPRATGPAAELLARLPRDSMGDVDWGRALTERTIEPVPGLDPKAAAQDVLTLDVELAPEGNPKFKTVFSHKAHTEWLGCDSCHTEIFEMATGAAKMSMADLYAGRYCGACHGPVAFPATSCARCHPAATEQR